MTLIAKPTAPLFQLFQTVSNRGETDKALIILEKIPSVSPLHRFGGRCPRDFNGDGQRIKIPKASSPKTMKQRNRQRFIAKYQ